MQQLKPSEAIRQILENPPIKYVGLCKNYDDVMGENLCRDMDRYGISAGDWPNYSGDEGYPVPAPEGYDDGPCLYYWSVISKWDKRTTYGKSRREYARWLIEQFEARGA